MQAHPRADLTNSFLEGEQSALSTLLHRCVSYFGLSHADTMEEDSPMVSLRAFHWLAICPVAPSTVSQVSHFSYANWSEIQALPDTKFWWVCVSFTVW